MKKDIIQVFSTNLIKFFVTLIASFFIPALLSIEEYGLYKLYALYVSFIGFFHFGFCDGIFLKYGGIELRNANHKEIANEQTSIIIYEMILTVGMTMVGFLKHDIIILFFGLSFLPNTLIYYYTFMFQATGLFKQYAQVYNMNSLLNLLFYFILVFVIKPSKGVYFVISQVVVSYIVFLFIYISFNKEYSINNGKFQFEVLFDNMKLGILLMIGNISYVFFTSIDKWFIKFFYGMEDFAYYSFAVQLLSAINMFINPIALTFYSYMSKRKNQKYEYKIKSIITSLLFFMLSGVFVLRFFVETFIKKYIAAVPVIYVLFLSQVFLLLNTSIYVNLFKVYKMQKKYFYNLIIAIIYAVLLNFIFYYLFGKQMESIAIATVVAMIIWSFLNLRVFPYLRFNKKNLLFVLVCSSVYIILSFSSINIFFQLFIYLMIWFIALRIFTKDIFDYFSAELRGIINKVRSL